MSKKSEKPVMKKSINEEHAKEKTIAVNFNESKKTSKSVQSMNDVSKQRTLVSARRMEKIMKSGESVYLAIFHTQCNPAESRTVYQD